MDNNVQQAPKNNRKAKNILMGAGIAVCVGGVAFTMWYAGQNGMGSSATSPSGMGSMSEMGSGGPGGSGGGGTPPEMPGGSSSSNSNSNSGSNSGSGSSSTSQPPEKPSGDSSNSNSGSSSSSETPPAKPDGESDDMSMGGPGAMGGQGDEMGMPASETATDFTWLYYTLFTIFSLAIAFLAMHLILSQGNKKSFKETYHSADKKVIIVLSSVLIAAVCVFGESYATTHWLSASQQSQGAPGGQTSSGSASYSAVVTIDESKQLANQSYTSSTANENVVLATGKIDATVSDTTINKTGDASGGDSTSFYGVNSGVVAKDGANLTLKNLTVNTEASGANGVFSYGGSATTNNSSSDGTTVNISDSKITTTKDDSGGIMTTGGGTMNATNLTINTAGTSSAAIRSDRGGGNVNVTGGTYTTTGVGSPAIYSTAAIKTSNAKLIAQASEGVVIEGANSVELDNTELTDTNSQLNGQSTTYKNIFLYQSMSGDASTNGGSTFTAKNSKITTNKGDTLYVTNTTATINLENNTITNNDNSGNFLRIQKDSWGNSGSNGGAVTLNLTNQTVAGNIVVDSISTLTANLQSGSSYTGTINGDKSAKSLTLKLSKDSKITLTGDSYVTSLENADSSNSNINLNGHKLYVNGQAI